MTWPGLPDGGDVATDDPWGFLGGGLWAGLCGYLRAKGLLSEVLSTLLMNSVAGFLLQYLVFGVWHDPKSSNFPQSKPYPYAAVLPHIVEWPSSRWCLFCVGAVALFWFVLYKTRWGYEMRAIGGNQEAAKRSGIPIAWYIVLLFVIGGGMAGIGGMAETSAIQGRLRPGFSSGYGYIGFLISWMSGHNPDSDRGYVISPGCDHVRARCAPDHSELAGCCGEHFDGADSVCSACTPRQKG